ncbi:hypothetical protein MPDQ_000181 [Monascus purpureus]|uniref:Mitotic checkpoint regulator, MAD2B-interacting-domain-containing protein n=1 Tax=Monascus purpureus TaxID=5098 RepID=A0A507R1C8_MONPU|nr:hypothetical protein MPDQ_000181 [Monascus purpureus]BDD59227.1 hypothetical protein MAP00_004450 [Monascus purpureus]
MALVSYSDSESDTENVPMQVPEKKPVAALPSKHPATGNFQAIVDRSNSRKIRVALPEIKPENPADEEDGPVRKKARVGGGGAFSGFNALLPAPKRNNEANTGAKITTSSSTRKVFSLKTGATPGFDREADTEMRRDYQAQASGGGSHEETGSTSGAVQGEEQPVKKEPKLVGNAMMFKPLSVGRNQKKKPKSAAVVSNVEVEKGRAQPPEKRHSASESPSAAAPAPPLQIAQKPKVSLFSLSTTEDKTGLSPETQTQLTAYKPLVYCSETAGSSAEAEPGTQAPSSTAPTECIRSEPQVQTLENIADDLNLSRSQRRHLFGRQPASSKSQVLTFNTDKEYAANQALSRETDLAAAQHNPVRPIAPGKHTLQQLVNVASNQRDALEESFATGRRNKKEAGSKYGW